MKMLLICLISLNLAVIMGLFIFKTHVRQVYKELHLVQREIEEKQEAIHMLSAEFSHLTSPDRLEKLAKRYLKLQPIEYKHMMKN